LDAPTQVLALTHTPPVQLNQPALDEWQRALPDVLKPLGRAMIDHVLYVKWPQFLMKLQTVTGDVIQQLVAIRERHDATITVVMLNDRHLGKSNAWLTAYLWERYLKYHVDFVVSDWKSAVDLFRLLHHASIGLPDSAMDVDSDEEVAQEVGHLYTFLPALIRQWPRNEETLPFKLNILYVDDMVYSGTQLSETAFDYPMFIHQSRISSTEGRERRPNTRDMTFFLIVPYMATEGQRRIEQRSHENNTNVYLSPAMVSVRGYGSLLQQEIAACRTALAQVDMQPETRESLEMDLNLLENMELPAVVFEHKLADSVSIPEELFSVARNEPGPLRIPLMVPFHGMENRDPFYKQPGMQWWNRQKKPLHDTTQFAEPGLTFLARAVLL